jgi:hypothetical protein
VSENVLEQAVCIGGDRLHASQEQIGVSAAPPGGTDLKREV